MITTLLLVAQLASADIFTTNMACLECNQMFKGNRAQTKFMVTDMKEKMETKGFTWGETSPGCWVAIKSAPVEEMEVDFLFDSKAKCESHCLKILRVGSKAMHDQLRK